MSAPILFTLRRFKKQEKLENLPDNKQRFMLLHFGLITSSIEFICEFNEQDKLKGAWGVTVLGVSGEQYGYFSALFANNNVEAIQPIASALSALMNDFHKFNKDVEDNYILPSETMHSLNDQVLTIAQDEVVSPKDVPVVHLLPILKTQLDIMEMFAKNINLTKTLPAYMLSGDGDDKMVDVLAYINELKQKQ